MFDIYQQAVGSMKCYENALRMCSDNLMQSQTVGFKATQTSFESGFSRVISAGSGGQAGVGGTNPIQLGGMVSQTSCQIDFTQGEMGTGNATDLAISGNGFFMLSADGGKTMTYSRAGQFQVSASGYLVSLSGSQVFGFQ